MLLLGAVVVVVVVVVLVLLLSSGGSSSKTSSATAASRSTTTAPSGTSSTAGTSQAKIVAQNNLNPPGGASSTTKGAAFVVKLGSALGIIIRASGVPPNNHNSYAAWLYNSATDSYRLGFVNPPVGKNGQLEVGTNLPTNAGHYKQLLLTRETQSNPKTPGAVVLQGPFSVGTATG